MHREELSAEEGHENGTRWLLALGIAVAGLIGGAVGGAVAADDTISSHEDD